MPILRNPLLVVVAVGLLCTAARADSILLASFDRFEGGGGAPEPRFEVQVVLRHDTFDPPHDPVALGHGIWWADGDTGMVDFTSAGHADFDRFAGRLTDGIDDELISLVLASGGGAGHGEPESFHLGSAPDLVGSQIDLIRLIVNDVSIEPYTSPDGGHLEGISWYVESTYEIWGHPVPEPTTLFLMVLGSAGCYFRSRSQRHRLALR